MEVLKWLIPSLAALYCIICLGMWIFQERFVFFPYPVPGDTTYEFSGVWEEQLLNRGNGVLLHTVLFRSKESKGLIFHSHGNAGILKYWGKDGREIADKTGYDVLMWDYRNFGKSRGKYWSDKEFFADAAYVYDHFSHEYTGKPIIAMGRSLGSGIAVWLGGERTVSGVILETPYWSLTSVAQTRFPYLPVKWLIRYPFRSELYMGNIQVPVLILHGTQDSITPYTGAQKLKQLLPEKHVQFVTLTDGTHSNLKEFDAYWDALTDFTNAQLRLDLH